MIKVDRIDREMAKKRIQKKTDFQFDFQIINYVYPKKQKQKSVHIINWINELTNICSVCISCLQIQKILLYFRHHFETNKHCNWIIWMWKMILMATTMMICYSPMNEWKIQSWIREWIDKIQWKEKNLTNFFSPKKNFHKLDSF